jgi:pimeloyl-ACP methyl ester carboxylesterase
MSFGRSRSPELIEPHRSPRIAPPGGCTSVRYWDGPAGGFPPIDPPDRQPVFLVHGFAGADHSWWALRSALAAAGFPIVIALRHNAFRIDINGVADWLVDHAERAMLVNGSTGVHLIGHSMGGLAVRAAVESRGLAGSATTAVTIATPHRGSGWARLMPGPAARQLRPGSEFLTGLDDPTEAHRPHWMNIYSADDRMVSVNSAALPQPASGLLGARQMYFDQVQQESVGHRSILRHPRIVGQIISTLVHHDDAARCNLPCEKTSHEALVALG